MKDNKVVTILLSLILLILVVDLVTGDNANAKQEYYNPRYTVSQMKDSNNLFIIDNKTNKMYSVDTSFWEAHEIDLNLE